MYQQVCQNIIRPLREVYRIARLGPQEITIQSKVSNKSLQVSREDDIIVNNYNQKIHLSFYNIKNLEKKPPCVIYLHANNGSRSQGIPYIKSILEQQIVVLLFDCAGSGLSDGQYVTLGVRQAEDLAKIVEYLTTKKGINDLALWGRSMGAVASLIYCSRNIRPIKACIYDSPFCSLRTLIKELANQKTGLPEFFFQIFMKGVDTQLIKKANFCLQDLDLLKRIETIKTPAMFLTSSTDILVKSNHVQQLFQYYPAQKYYQQTSSQHHESRPLKTIEKCVNFIKNKFEGKEHNKTIIKSRKQPEINPEATSHWDIKKKFKQLGTMFNQDNSIMCFLRQGCWQGPTNRKILKPNEEQRQSTRGIDNWKTMIQKSQKQGQDQKVSKAPPSKVSLKRMLDQPSAIRDPTSKSQPQPHPQPYSQPSLTQRQISTQPFIPSPSPPMQASFMERRTINNQNQLMGTSLNSKTVQKHQPRLVSFRR